MLLSTSILRYAPAVPGVPLVVTDVVYSEPSLWVPSIVWDSFIGLFTFVESDKSKWYV